MLAETESLLKALDEANVFVLNNICRTVRCPLPHCELTLIAGIGDKHKYETSKVGCVVSIQTGGCPTSTLLSTNMTLATDMWSLDTNLGLTQSASFFGQVRTSFAVSTSAVLQKMCECLGKYWSPG